VGNLNSKSRNEIITNELLSPLHAAFIEDLIDARDAANIVMKVLQLYTCKIELILAAFIEI